MGGMGGADLYHSNPTRHVPLLRTEEGRRILSATRIPPGRLSISKEEQEEKEKKEEEEEGGEGGEGGGEVAVVSCGGEESLEKVDRETFENHAKMVLEVSFFMLETVLGSR